MIRKLKSGEYRLYSRKLNPKKVVVIDPQPSKQIKALEKRELIERRPHPQDGRALGLHTTAAGQQLMKQAEKQAAETERLVAHRLAPQEQEQLIALLQKIYL